MITEKEARRLLKHADCALNMNEDTFELIIEKWKDAKLVKISNLEMAREFIKEIADKNRKGNLIVVDIQEIKEIAEYYEQHIKELKDEIL